MKMMFKRRYFLLLAALFFCFGALLFFFVHEGRLLLPEEEPAARYNIQVIFKALANPPDFWRVVEQGVQSAAAEYGVNCEVTAPPMEKDVARSNWCGRRSPSTPTRSSWRRATMSGWSPSARR